MTMKYVFFALGMICILSSCEDIVEVDLKSGAPQLQVDAFIDDEIGNHVIKLRETNNYFDSKGAPAATGAMVRISDLFGRTFNYLDADNDGDYEYKDSISNPFSIQGFPGMLYTLEITYKGETYRSQAYMDSVPSIDSLFTEFRETEIFGPDTIKAGYVLNMHARDLPGEGNCYWFKSYRNGIFYNKPSQMNIAYDAAFGPGSDNVQFIPPIIFGLSPERLSINDSAHVEIYSIGIPTYYFLLQCRTQMNNTGLFATPSTNVPTNIENINKDGKHAVGWFSMASVSRKGIRVKG